MKLKRNLVNIYLKYFYIFYRNYFNSFYVRENTVLLIEFYFFHGETIPGYTKYLLDLGYNVDVIIRKPKKSNGRNDISLFSCFNSNNKVNIITLKSYEMNFLFRSSCAARYKKIIINTFNDEIEKDYLYHVNIYNLKPVCVAHNININSDYLHTNRVISLVNIISKYFTPFMVNPHYFGDYNQSIKKNKLSNITTFIAFNTNEICRRNLKILYLACDILYKKRIFNFYVKVLGKGIPIPDIYKKNIHDLGFIEFAKMFEEISSSDFILSLIDQDNASYTNKASGTYQLSYGLIKPIILNSLFSNISGFNNYNSILYNNDNDLADTMERCINMLDRDYDNIVISLKKSQIELYNKSLNNLREVLSI